MDRISQLSSMIFIYLRNPALFCLFLPAKVLNFPQYFEVRNYA
jgi:hypothetical protein